MNGSPLTDILYYSKDMESFATGLKRIQDACDEAGCKAEYYGDEYGFTVRFYRHCGEGWGTDMGANGSTPEGPKVQNEPLEEPLEMKIKKTLAAGPKTTYSDLEEEFLDEIEHTDNRRSVRKERKAETEAEDNSWTLEEGERNL